MVLVDLNMESRVSESSIHLLGCSLIVQTENQKARNLLTLLSNTGGLALVIAILFGCSSAPSLATRKTEPLATPSIVVTNPSFTSIASTATITVFPSPISTTAIVRAQSNGSSHNPSVSADGQFVAFQSDASNLVQGDTNGVTDIFVYTRVTERIERVSIASDGSQASGASINPSISADGRIIAFVSWASNLAPGDTNTLPDPPPTNAPDIFVHDRQTGETERVSIASNSMQANDRSDNPSISGDGRYVAFVSWASNLVRDDTNDAPDIFVHDRQSGKTERVSIASDGAQSNGWSEAAAISADGRWVAFVSQATNLVPNAVAKPCGVFVHDRSNGQTDLASLDPSGHPISGSGPSISKDGHWVAFWDPHVYLRDRRVERTILVASNVLEYTEGGTCGSGGISLSADGNWLAYSSEQTPDHTLEIFLSSLQERREQRITHGNAMSNTPSLSADGRWLAFRSSANDLVAGDTNGVEDIFLYDRLTEKIERVSVPAQ